LLLISLFVRFAQGTTHEHASQINSQKIDEAKIPSSSLSFKWTLASIPVDLLANQLTLVEAELYNKIQAWEVTSLGFQGYEAQRVCKFQVFISGSNENYLMSVSIVFLKQ